MISHSDKLAISRHQLHGVKQSRSTANFRWMPFHSLGNDSSLLHFSRRAELLPKRSERNVKERILRIPDRVQLQLPPITLKAFEIPWSQMLRSHPWLEIHYTVTEGAGPSL